MTFPSIQFDDTVDAVCMGTASRGDMVGLHAVLRVNSAARDHYLWQVEIHSRLAQMGMHAIDMGDVKPPAFSRQTGVVASSATRRRSAAALVAALILIAATGWYWAISLKHRMNSLSSEIAHSTSSNPVHQSSPREHQAGAGGLSGIYRPTVHFASAADAPVIVGTGRAEPIDLGSEVPYAQSGDTLHIWDWSKSPTSRVMKDVRLWPADVIAVSPDGRKLIWASGKILDLTNGAASTIDLGGEFYLDDTGAHLPRIQQIWFAPGGRELVLLVSNIVLGKSTHPLRQNDFSTARSIQIVSFPEGKLICQFPANLPIAFSADAKRVVSATPEHELKQQIVERNALTGEVIHNYEPRIGGFAYEITLSSDASRLGVSDGAGEVLIWDTATHELKHRVHLPVDSAAHLAFSPDGKWLAVSLLQKTSVVAVDSGTIVQTFPMNNSAIIRWAADSKSFDAISNVMVGALTQHPGPDGNDILYNEYPAVKNWKLSEKN